MPEESLAAKSNLRLPSFSTSFFLVVTVLIAAVVLTWPILPNILPHADEYQFYFNAWSILWGKELQNYFHVAFTEYSLAGFLAIANLLTPSGVNFPNGDPSVVTYYYGRLFGFILYLTTFIFGSLLLQKGETKVKIRVVFFAILYFGSLGLFERFLRVNSDSMLILVFLNYLLISLHFHKARFSSFHFFLLNLIFMFLGTFTNLKFLYLALPLLAVNFTVPFLWYDESETGRVSLLPKLYRFIIYGLGILAGSVILWTIFMPKPFNPNNFWMGIRNTIVHGAGFDFNYPSQSHGTLGSWSANVYDFFVEYLGLSQLVAALILVGLAFYLGKKDFWEKIKGTVKNQIRVENLTTGNLYLSTELLVFVCFLAYYVGLSRTIVHWSRWNAPFGFFGIILLSVLLEKSFLYIKNYPFAKGPHFWFFLLSLFVFAWSLRVFMFYDISASGYPAKNGSKLISQDAKAFLKGEGIQTLEEIKKKAVWFSSQSEDIGSTSIENLTEPEYREVRYLFWPYWNISSLYENRMVDKETHNQIAFVQKYAEKVIYRTPTILSRYIHYTKYFAWRYLGITWYPEIESVVEAQYGIVKLKDLPSRLSLNYIVPFSGLTYYYFPYSLIYNLKNLPNGYMFPPCNTNPEVFYLSSGAQVPANPDLGGGRTTGLHCHGLRFRVALRGTYTITLEGLPPDVDGKQVVYSAYRFDYDAPSRTITFKTDQTAFAAEFGVATKEKRIPNLRFIVNYESSPQIK